jgi:hypothetical protein
LRARLRAPALLLTAGTLALGALAGCGDDDEGVEVTVPEISVEDTTTEAAPTATTETIDPQTGGTGAPSADPNQEDSETNDKPPAPGSPEEAFEQACEENPAACG